ncbi:hypothetical protein PBRA_009328 [Plasmodiophora brassicae]|uniref:Uncharacterized protein n=1 Tax=Plasmodiophora brassicae TaxID=37360 RepID=A0A0G4J700_PLABS|nr:hypothetical protein PBRA_009328 [Plasmodiophora brassicae]
MMMMPLSAYQVEHEEVAPAAAEGTLGVEIGEDAHRQGIAKDFVIISSDEDSYDDQVIMVDDDDGPGIVVVGDECSEPEAERGRDHLRRTGFLDDIARNPVGIREPSPRPRKSEKRRHGALPGTEPTTWTARQDQHLRLACKNEIRESAVTSILDPKSHQPVFVSNDVIALTSGRVSSDKELLRMALSLIHGKTLGEAIQRAEHLQLLTRDQLVHLSR